MEKLRLLSLLCPLLLLSSVVTCHSHERKVHVVYMGDRPQGDVPAKLMHNSMLETILGSTSSAAESLVYSYERSFNGFAANLSKEEAHRVAEMEGVISVFPNKALKLHTTRSWDFMGLSESSSGSSQEGDVIVGILDTGVWPEAESFTDEGLSQPPAKWKGKCNGTNFTCNNKLIGARFYNSNHIYIDSDFMSPRDSDGHGTHTTSTVAGQKVHKASLLGLANGVARGGVPGARVAIYKVCWSNGCFEADILKAFDDAIADGVDILSISLGYDFPLEYFHDSIAIGSFHAMKHGILTSASASNWGPYPATVSNYAPWLLTVAASTIDRSFSTRVLLGNGEAFTGRSINTFALNGTSFPLIWGGDAANYSALVNSDSSKYCFPGCLNLYKVNGSIVLCEGEVDASSILLANGVGVIMASDYSTPIGDPYSSVLPATMVSIKDSVKIFEYIKSTGHPIATILVSEAWKDDMAPIVASFSSRGPNPISPNLLKPDLTAPGVDILAAWPPVAPPSLNPLDPRSVEYNIISGTSTSCPHATGTAAYVKAAHPYWSPAAIKSALMTTASVMDQKKHEDLEFAYGSGHLNPIVAIKPGLIFDLSESDYINFLCKQGYNSSTLSFIDGDSIACNDTESGKAWDLNYPSFTLAIEDGRPSRGYFIRTVTNVGIANSTYTVQITMPNSISVEVQPPILSFSTLGQKKTFEVFVEGPEMSQQPITSGTIVWKDGTHVVRAPFVVYTILPKDPFSSYSNSITKKKQGFGGGSIFRRNRILGKE